MRSYPGYAPQYYSIKQQGIPGSLMGRTMGFLIFYIGIFAAVAYGSLFVIYSGYYGIISMVGLVFLFGGYFAQRFTLRRGGALSAVLGAVVAIGAGMVSGPFVAGYAIYQPGIFISSMTILVLTFIACALVVSVTKFDFTRIWPLLYVGLFGLIIVTFLSFFLAPLVGVVTSPLFNILGVIIFTGYLLVNFSIMKYRDTNLPVNTLSAVLATRILINLINLLMFLLSLGRRR